MADRTVLVKLQADTASFKRGMADAAAATSKVADAQTKAQKSADRWRAIQAKAQESADRWRAIGNTSTVAGGAIAAGLLLATKAASNQEQAMGALGAVFKQNTGLMTANATKAREIGLSQTQYANSAAQLGSQLRNLGVSETDLAGTTDDMISKAADMSAQFGGTTADAVTALSALFRGERDPIERYGVTINDAAIKAEMAAGGFDKTQATLSLLNKQLESSGTIGAAAREYDTTAAATQRMRADFDNAAASLGEALLPAMTRAAEAASALLSAFNNLSPGMQTAASYASAFAAAALLIGPRIMQMVSAARLAAAANATLATSSGTATAALSTQATAIGANAVAVGKVVGLIGGLTYATNAVADGTVKVTELGGAAGMLGGQFDGVGDAVNNAAGVMTGAFGFLVSQSSSASAATEELAQHAQTYGTAITTAGTMTNSAAQAFGVAANAATRESQAVQALTNDLQTLIGLNLAASGSSDALIGQTQRLAAAVDANGKSLVGRNAASVANREAMRSEMGLILQLAKSRQDQVTAVKGEQAGLNAANNVINRHVGALKANAIAAGYSAKQVNAFVRQLRATPGTKSTKITTPGMAKAITDAFGLTKGVKGIPRSSSTKVTAPGIAKTIIDVFKLTGAAEDVPGSVDVDVDAPGAGQATRDLWGVKSAAESVPQSVSTTVSAATDAARNAVAGFVSYANSLSATISIYARKAWSDGGYVEAAAASFPTGRASGGYISGPGSAKSDSIPARLSNGEYVIRAAAVRKYGRNMLDMINATRFARGGYVSQAQEDLSPAAERRAKAAARAAALAALAAERRAEARRPEERTKSLRDYSAKQLKRMAKKGISGKKWRKLDKSEKQQRKVDAVARKNAKRDRDYEARQEKNRRDAEDARAAADAAREVADKYAAKREEAARKAQEARQKKHDKWKAELDALKERYNQIKQARLDFQRSVADAMQSNMSGIDVFDFDAQASAVDRYRSALTTARDATDALMAARRAANQASPSERTDAMRNLTDAQRAYSAAQLEAIRSEKAVKAAAPTTKNILQQYQQRAQLAERFRAGVTSLAKRGLDTDLVRELATSNPEESMDLIRALGGMNAAQLKQLNAYQRRTETAGGGLGAFLGQRFYGRSEDAARAAVAAKMRGEPSLAAAQTITITGGAPMVLKVDSREVWKGQLTLKRKTGNSYTARV